MSWIVKQNQGQLNQFHEVFNAIEAELSKVRPFVGSIDILSDKNDTYGENNVISAISIAVPGIVFGSIVFKIDAAPVTSFTFENGDIPHLDTITYV